MEQTLGKRISENRKKLGLTQDKLAEKLGVTAQAVSKWENDQACPDITMLPKLAEIFGITTDELLGVSPKEHEVVHTAEVVEDDGNAPEDFHADAGNWEFHWDAGRKNGIAIALWVLLAGGLLLASNLLDWGASFWDILWPSALLVFGLSGLLPRFSFFRLGCSLFGAYFLLNNLNFAPFELGKELLFPIVLVLFGLSLLVDALRKNRKPVFRFVHNGSKGENKKQKSAFSTDGESFSCSTSFGENRRPVSLERLSSGDASVNFGELTVDLSGCEELAPNCTIDANCSFGELAILVPRRWRVDHTSSTAFGSVSITGSPAPDPEGILHIDCSASFGEISIRYV